MPKNNLFSARIAKVGLTLSIHLPEKQRILGICHLSTRNECLNEDYQRCHFEGGEKSFA